MRVEAFEDIGARWDIPLEDIDRYQFERGSRRADRSVLDGYVSAVDRLDRWMEIPCDPLDRVATARRLEDANRELSVWLDSHSAFFAEGGVVPPVEERTGDPRLFGDLMAYMTHRGVAEIEKAFSRQFVSHPGAGEVVKGHRIVLAEMGLVPYRGKVVRDPATFEEPWDRSTRRRHLESRLGFVRAVYGRLDQTTPTVYRGMFMNSPVELDRNRTFVSWSFSRAVAESHFDTSSTGGTRMLQGQDFPVERALMTYLETEAMNETFKEAEAVLLFNEHDPLY